MTSKTSPTNAEKAAKAYDHLADRVIAALEAGTAPWRRPWSSFAVLPTNLKTGHRYTGGNLIMLALEAIIAGYNSAAWVGFKQAVELGYSVRKGEKGTPILIVKEYRPKDKETGEPALDEDGHPIVRKYINYAYVWNLEQLNDADGNPVKVSDQPTDFARPSFDAIIAAWADAPAVEHKGDLGAFYSPSKDQVTMPERGTFESPAHYYATLAHELTHSTGHPTRLARFEVDALPSEAEYSSEELIAEFGAMILCAEAGVETDFDNNAAYIAAWLKVLKNDRSLIPAAIQGAGEAVNYIMGN